MASIWMQARLDGVNPAARCVVCGIPAKAATDVVLNLDAEYRDMGLDIMVWVED